MAIGTDRGDPRVIDEANRRMEYGRQAAAAGNPRPAHMAIRAGWVPRGLDLEDHAFRVQPSSQEKESTGNLTIWHSATIEGCVLRTQASRKWYW